MNKQKQIIKLSKFLSLILRHKPEVIGLSLDSGGWANTDDLIKKSKAYGKNISMNLLKAVVETNDKKRFAFSKYNKKIRAHQGHSFEIDLELDSALPPDFLYHGTAIKFINSIMKNGLTPQKRHHVHLSKNQFTAESVGRRHGKLILLKINCKDMHKDGFKFMLTENEVWLTDIVPTKYIKIMENY